jgi:hypothetical protein
MLSANLKRIRFIVIAAKTRFSPGMTRFTKGVADVTGVTAHTRRAADAATIKICRNGRPERGR